MNEERVSEYEGWAIVELMGHARLLGEVREVQYAGATMLRVEVAEAGGGTSTRFVAAAALYAVSPISEETARALIAQGFASTPPVQPWEFDRTVTVGALDPAATARPLGMAEQGGL